MLLATLLPPSSAGHVLAAATALALVALGGPVPGGPVPGARVAVAGAADVAGVPGDTTTTTVPGRYVAPAPGAVVHAFDPPAERWSAGHRGVDIAAAPGDVVASPGAGVVTFAGPVAGRGVVVVTHPDGLRSSLEPLVPGVAAGDVVAAGDAVGHLAAETGAVAVGHCAPAGCVHWGVRRGETYLDPMTLLGDLPPVVLLPLR